MHREYAACAAALAAAGHGTDDPKPDDAAKAKLRGQALGWLMAEHDTWSKLLASDDAKARSQAVQTLERWKVDTDLPAIRDRDALAKLPESGRKQWQAFWVDVDALLKKARDAGR